MREVVSLTLFTLVFIVILHTTKGNYDSQENDPFYDMLYRRATKNNKAPNKTSVGKKGQQNKGSTKNTPKLGKPVKKKVDAKTTTKTTTSKTPAKPTATTTRRTQVTFPAMFPPLTNYQVGATPVSESKYPWVASVIHSLTRNMPLMCTAVCTDKAIFVTAARCILTLKVAYTSVKYQGHRFSVIAFITPSKQTYQSYEDIGIIVVDTTGFSKRWDTIGIDLIDAKRKDTKFQWFSDLNLSKETKKNKFRVVGYAAEKYYSKMRTPDFPEYKLSELDVKISRNMCDKVFYKAKVVGFDVPCYMACTLEQYMESTTQFEKYPNCHKYHGVEGGAIINVNTNKLLGVATWAITKDSGSTKNMKSKSEFPVGFAVPNSQNFINDYACAKKIRDSPKHTGSYQELCK